MLTHYLEHLFNPHSIAVIGASDKPLSVGANVLSNLLRGDFSGNIFPVNPKHVNQRNQLTLLQRLKLTPYSRVATPHC